MKYYWAISFETAQLIVYPEYFRRDAVKKLTASIIKNYYHNILALLFTTCQPWENNSKTLQHLQCFTEIGELK
jgi:hypothetical protein